jgi:hypothetical protein
MAVPFLIIISFDTAVPLLLIISIYMAVPLLIIISLYIAVPILHCCTVQTALEFGATDNNIIQYGSTDPLLQYSTDCCGVLVYC